jgi:predicted phage terminase large subunit-like protein
MTYDGTLTANSGSDFVGITINAVSAENKDKDETWYILSSKKYRELPSTMTDIVCLQLMVFRPLYLWAEPGCISAEMMADVQKFISLHELPTAIRDLKLSKKAGAKEKRINALQTRYKKGQIRLQEGPWCRDLTEEMDLWTGIADLEHDDGLDSLSMQSGIAKPCGIEKLSELFEEDPRDDPEWDDPGMMGDWNARPWQGINIAEAAKRSFDGGPSRFAMQLEEAGKQVVNMEQMYPNESEHKRRIGGHAGIHSRRKGQK